MPTYRARCVTQGGRFFAQDCDAPNVAALRASIEARGAFMLQEREIAVRSGRGRTRLRLETLVHLFDLLAMQLAAGVPVELATAKLKDEFPDRAARAVLRGIHAELASSTASLSGALAKYPRSFPEGFVAAVRAGEEAGGPALAARLEDLRDQIAFRLTIRRTAAQAVAYPAFILAFAGGVIGLLVVKLVPSLRLMLDSLNVPLPAITNRVLGISSLVQTSWPWMLGSVALLVIAIRLLRLLPPLATATDRMVLQLPFLGGILQALVTAEVAKNYRALYSTGADAGATLASCARVVRNRALKAALLRSRTLLESGRATAGNPDAPVITAALRATGYFPELALTIIGTGESSGALAPALDNVAKYYALRAQERVRVFFAIFEKAVMLGVIAIVGVIVIGLWLPIMSAAQNIHP
jgi:type IV pilus assembly protein PilC